MKNVTEHFYFKIYQREGVLSYIELVGYSLVNTVKFALTCDISSGSVLHPDLPVLEIWNLTIACCFSVNVLHSKTNRFSRFKFMDYF
jgi:hypothetical protein